MPNCTGYACKTPPAWHGTISSSTAPARHLEVWYCDECADDRRDHIAGTDGIELVLEPIREPETRKLESPVHRAFRVEYLEDTSSFKVTHTDCGGVVLRTQSVSVETLVLLPVLHAPDCTATLD